MANKLQRDGESLLFPNNGRGVFIYTKKISHGGVVEIYLTIDQITDNRAPKDDFMRFRIDGKGVKIDVHARGDSEEIFTKDGQAKGSSGLEQGRTASYWISIDRDSLLLKYGKGYLMKETTFKSIDFKDEKNKTTRKKVEDTFLSPALPLYLTVFIPEHAKQEEPPIETQPNLKPMIEVEPVFQFKRLPLAGDLPHFVKDSSATTLFDLDSGRFTLSDDLPTASQELYNIIKNCDLEYPEVSSIKLSDAIRYSIENKGMFLNKLMENKKRTYDVKGHVYIRVTLGPDMLTAPGIPYVLEIWPKGSKSPIHDHGGACTAMKILFGGIHIGIYNKVMNPPSLTDMKPLMEFDGKQGDITWMDENWYQTHKLENNTDDFCAIIQSYRYRSDDNMQWPGFDYIQADDDSSQKIVYPGSDTTFKVMRDAVLADYTKHLDEEK